MVIYNFGLCTFNMGILQIISKINDFYRRLDIVDLKVFTNHYEIKMSILT